MYIVNVKKYRNMYIANVQKTQKYLFDLFAVVSHLHFKRSKKKQKYLFDLEVTALLFCLIVNAQKPILSRVSIN